MAQNEMKAKCGLPVEVRSMEGLGVGFVADSFDVVAVWTDDECAIVVRVIVRPKARSAVVFAPSF